MAPTKDLERMAAESTLWAAWAKVAAGIGIAGVDGVNVAQYGRHLGPHMERLSALLRGGRYQPAALRALAMPIRGKRRRLAIPTIEDRLVQRAFLEVCGGRLDARSAEVSFAYRKGRSWLDALAAAERCRDQGLRSVLRSDVAEFFGSIDHAFSMRR